MPKFPKIRRLHQKVCWSPLQTIWIVLIINPKMPILSLAQTFVWYSNLHMQSLSQKASLQLIIEKMRKHSMWNRWIFQLNCQKMLGLSWLKTHFQRWKRFLCPVPWKSSLQKRNPSMPNSLLQKESMVQLDRQKMPDLSQQNTHLQPNNQIMPSLSFQTPSFQCYG